MEHADAMSSYAHVRAQNTRCPRCAGDIAFNYDLVAFQWGYCPSRVPWNALFYSFGEPILWRLDDDERARAWVYFDGALQGGNLGDPTFPDVLVRALDLGGGDVKCARCGVVDLALRVERGVLTGFAAMPAGCDIATVDARGNVIARPEWDDHAMPEVLRVRSKRLARGDGGVVRDKQAP